MKQNTYDLSVFLIVDILLSSVVHSDQILCAFYVLWFLNYLFLPTIISFSIAHHTFIVLRGKRT